MSLRFYIFNKAFAVFFISGQHNHFCTLFSHVFSHFSAKYSGSTGDDYDFVFYIKKVFHFTDFLDSRPPSIDEGRGLFL